MSQSAPSPELAFVLRLGQTLQAFGESAQTVEEALGRVAGHLGLEGAVYATPTGLLTSFGRAGEPVRTDLIRTATYGADLEKLAETGRLVDRVLAGRLGAEEALGHLEALASRPARWGGWALAGAYALAASGMAVVFGGGWREALLGALIGGLVGLCARALDGSRSQVSLLPLAGGLLSSLGGLALAALFPGVSQPVLVLSGFIVLVPGLGLLVSMQELGTGNLVAGASRLMGTGFVLLLLAAGVAVGQRLGGAWFPAPPSDPQALPAWAALPAVALASFGFLVVFRGTPRDYPWTFLASLLAYGGAKAGAALLGPEAGAGAAALLLGAACNHYARLTRRPGAVLLLPSLMLVLPGSLGFRSFLLMLHKQTLEGLQAGFQSIFVAVALMLGLLLANALVPRRRF